MGLFAADETHAQPIVPSEITIRNFNADSVVFLGNWVVQDSIKVWYEGSIIPKNAWVFNSVKGTWKANPANFPQQPPGGTLIIRYWSLPLVLRREFMVREPVDTELLNDTLASTGTVQVLSRRNASSGLFGNADLQQSGSLSRGIIVGSNQDFALESGLQFDLNGQLTDDVTINASITDRNLPIQPDGSTQNLREFDRVFIELESRSTNLQMGDIDISLQQSEFAKLNRRLQGATGKTDPGFGEYKGAISVARGTFRIAVFRGQDGVQGPYRLTGATGEEFITVLAGSEKVYIDGQLIQRGEENQYVIDYGLGELFFTNNLIITDEMRITVEYQFLNQDFTRTLTAAEAREDNLFGGKLSIGVTYIREADGDNLLSQRTLSEREIDILQNAGDDLSRAIVSGADSTGLNETNSVLYARVDTVFNGEAFEIFKNIPGSPLSRFTVRFTRVEQGAGDYRRIGGTVNGLLFEWVGPGNGDYVPFRQLPAPVLQQMTAIDMNLNLTPNVQLFGEFAASFFDANRFSDLDDDDNSDAAYNSGFRIHSLKTGLGVIAAQARRRFSGNNFRFFDRTRDIEFSRKWNILNDTEGREELTEGRVSVQNFDQTGLAIEYGRLERIGLESNRQAFSLETREKNLPYLTYNQDFVDSKIQALNQEGDWFRHKAETGYVLPIGTWKLIPTIRFEQEDRNQKIIGADSLLNTSFSFMEIGQGLVLEKDALRLGGFISFRDDRAALNGVKKDQSDAVEQSYFVEYRPGTFFNTQHSLALRKRTFTDAFLQSGTRANRRGILIRSQTGYKSVNKIIDGELFYEANSQRRSVLQESFVEVGSELGQFTWRDINGDGVQQIDEFFPEITPNEGTFIRQFLPSDELFPVIDLNTRLRNSIKPFALFSSNQWLKEVKLISRFDIREVNTTQNESDIYLLKFSKFRDDSTTIQGRFFWEKELDIFPESDTYGLSTRFNQGRTFNRRSTEVQKLFSQIFSVSMNYRPEWKLNLRLDGSISTNRAQSDILSSRNFDILTRQIEPGVDYVFTRSFSTGFSVSYARKEDTSAPAKVTADLLRARADVRGFLWRAIQTTTRLEWRNANLSGNSSSFGTFELTDGLGEGSTLLWSLNASYTVSRWVRMNLNYDGRTAKNNPSIHTVKFVVSAIF